MVRAMAVCRHQAMAMAINRLTIAGRMELPAQAIMAVATSLRVMIIHLKMPIKAIPISQITNLIVAIHPKVMAINLRDKVLRRKVMAISLKEMVTSHKATATNLKAMAIRPKATAINRVIRVDQEAKKVMAGRPPTISPLLRHPILTTSLSI